MDLTRTPTERAFRDQLRAWLESNASDDPPVSEGENFGWRRDQLRRLFGAGLAGVHWPIQYGGRGATLTGSAIFFEELARSGAPRPAALGTRVERPCTGVSVSL